MLSETAEAPGTRGRGRCSARAPAVKLSGDGVGLTHPLRGLVELAPVGRSVGSPLRGSPSSRPAVARFEPTRAGAFAPASWKLLYGRGGIGFLPLRGTRRARDLRSLGSNPRGRALSPLPRGNCYTDGVGLASSRYAGLAELATCGRSVRTHEGGRFRPCLVETAIRTGWDWLPPAARDSPSSRPAVARFEPTRAGAFAPASWKLLYGRGGIRTHEAGLLPTRSPGVRLSPLGHPSGSLRGEAGGREAEGVGLGRRSARLPELATCGRSVRTHETLSSRPHLPSQAEGVGFEPTRLFRVNALAGRRLKPLGHPSAGSCCPDWPARTRTWNLLVQSQTCCQFHHGPTSQ